MIPLGVVRYLLIAGVFVCLLFFGLRLLFAGQEQREIWRYKLRRRWYVGHQPFRRIARIVGTLCLLLSGITGYFIIMDLLE